MLEPLGLVGFLALGLLGGFGHCVGMCLPFVLLVGRRFGGPAAGGARVLGAQLLYSGGRVAVYTALGVAAGALGSAVELLGAMVGLQRAASVVAGGVLVCYATAALLGLAPVLAGNGGRLFGRLAGLLQGRAADNPLVMGLLLGFLPCGLVYSAVIAAAALGSPFRGGAALALFGLGTVPAMLGVSVADALLVRHRGLVNRLSQAAMLAMGLWFVWKGIGGF